LVFPPDPALQQGGGGGHGGGGGKGGPGGGTGGGGSGGSGATTGYGPGSNFSTNPWNGPPVLLHHIPMDQTSPIFLQTGLRELALGTGGFWIMNTNDLGPGLDKVISELLAGLDAGKTLEQVAASSTPGTIPVSLEAPYFYTAPDAARVDLALNIPGSSLAFEKQKGDLHAEVNVLGIAFRSDGSVVARFSDTSKVDIEKGKRKEFEKQPFVYRNSFAILPGRYDLRVVLSPGGHAYAKYAMPPAIEPFNGKQLQVSSVVLSDTVRDIAEVQETLAPEIIEGRTPLVVRGLQIFPSSTNHFSRSEKIALYTQIFEPDPIQDGAPRVEISFSIVDAKTNLVVYESPATSLTKFVRPGNPIIPALVWLRTDKFPPGSYRLEAQARDSKQNVSAVQSADLDLE